MKPRSLVILTLLVAILGGFIFFYERELPSTEERVELAKKVLTIEKDDVRTVTIEWDGRRVKLDRPPPPAGDSDDEAAGDEAPEIATGAPSIAAEREWRLVEPLTARADHLAVDALVGSITALEKGRTLEDVDPGELGLDQPRATVTLVAGEVETVLRIGAELPASDDMLVGVAGRSELYQVSGSLWDELTKDPGDWRDKKLFDGTRADVERIALRGADDRILLARRGDDFWIESPLADRAADDPVNGLLSELAGLEVARFLDEPPESAAELGLEPARAVLEVVLKDREQPFRIELGRAVREEEETLYARSGDQLVEITTKLLDSFAASPAAWRSRSWTGLQTFKIESARIEDAEGVVEVSRDDADWKRGEERIGYTAVSDVLYAVTDAKAEEVLSRQEAVGRGHGLDQPALAITLTTEENVEELQLFPEVDGLAAATAGDRDAVLLIAAEAVDEIRRKLKDLRVAEPLPDEEAAEEADDGGVGESAAAD
ncbi:MAG: DUF4340 domain-containing protein [bacterium]|nr:DUF4340 domain-containing protein [bacterium]